MTNSPGKDYCDWSRRSLLAKKDFELKVGGLYTTLTRQSWGTKAYPVGTIVMFLGFAFNKSHHHQHGYFLFDDGNISGFSTGSHLYEHPFKWIKELSNA